MSNVRPGQDLFVVTSTDCTEFYGAYIDVEAARARTGYGMTDSIIIVYTPADLPPVNTSGDTRCV